MTNCKNCGAPLHNYKCDYCGTEYEYIQEINDFKQVITLFIGGHKRKFYIGSITREPEYIEYYTCSDETQNIITMSKDNITLELISYD